MESKRREIELVTESDEKTKPLYISSVTESPSVKVECGVKPFAGYRWMNRLANIRWFTFFAAIYGFSFGLFPLYTVSQITTLEKHFDLSSQKSGMILSGSEIGFMLSAVIVGYFSNAYHRPRIIGACSILIGLGCLIVDIPFYLDMSKRGHDRLYELEYTDNYTCGSSNRINCTDDVATDDVSWMFGYFLVATILYGAGSCGMWTIGISYIDDNADKKKAYFYVADTAFFTINGNTIIYFAFSGIVICIRFLAPFGGLMLGSLSARIPVHNFDEYISSHGNMVGAWWLGYYVILGMVILSSLPFWCYPKVLHRLPEQTHVYTVSLPDYGAESAMNSPSPPGGIYAKVLDNKSTDRLEDLDWRSPDEQHEALSVFAGFPSALLRLAKNPIFLFGSLATSLDFSISIGFGAFVPKYFEAYFHTSAATANAVSGVSLALSACIGSGLGGFIMSRIRWRFSRMLLVATVVNMAICGLVVPMILLRCPSSQLTGMAMSSLEPVNTTCRSACDCENVPYQPVCDSDTSYFSSCHAGCTQKYSNGTYGSCACTLSQTVRPGLCEDTCTLEMGLYAAFLFLLVLCLSAAEIPAYMLNIRSVAEQDKALALAVLNVFTSAFAFPMPILFGWLIDGACLIHQKLACSDGAACMRYDTEQLKYRLHLLTACLKIVPTILYIVAWYLAKDRLFAGDEKALNKNVLDMDDSATDSSVNRSISTITGEETTAIP